MTIMRGATMARLGVANYLRQAVPLAYEQYKEPWGMDSERWPLPVRYDAYEPTGLDGRVPLVGVTVARTRGWGRVDVDNPMAEVYRARYDMRVFTWVHTPLNSDDFPIQPEYDETIRHRDDLAALIRICLLTRLNLGDDETFLVNEGTLVESFSDPTKIKGDRWSAGATHDFELQVDETLNRFGIGNADTIDTSFSTLPQ